MSGEPGLRERKKREARRHIATTAVGMFLERGFDEVSVAEVAEAAGVSKMTVFNHFPAKEDLVFELGGRSLPALGEAVRGRPAGQSPIEAVRLTVRTDFEERGGDEDQAPRMRAFLRMAFRSPTLLQRFGQQWNDVQTDLAAALAEVLGEPAPPKDVELGFLRAVRGDGDDEATARWLRGMNARSMVPFFAAGQIVSTLQQITMASLVRVAAGATIPESTAAALRDTDAAFGLLERGLGGLGET